jgi:transposase-like protein
MSQNLVLYSGKPCCPSGCHSQTVKRGFYTRHGKRIQRLQCSACRKSFCEEINWDTYQEKKRYLRKPIFLHLCSGYSQRRLARILNISRTTVVRKFIKMGRLANQLLLQDQAQLNKVVNFEFDDMETFCHTKYKPYSISLAIESKTRRIIGFESSPMPAKGRIAEKALKKIWPEK